LTALASAEAVIDDRMPGVAEWLAANRERLNTLAVGEASDRNEPIVVVERLNELARNAAAIAEVPIAEPREPAAQSLELGP